MKTNTNLESVFNLAPADDDISEPITKIELDIEDNQLTTAEILSKVDKIASALPEVKGLESSDQELDDLADYAIQSYKDIQDLGFNVDMKHSAEILSVAGNMLAHAINAKTNKINKKLKMIELQIKKQRVDIIENEKSGNQPEEISGKSTTIDRNQFLREFMEAKKAS